MQVEWKIIYSNGSTFTNLDGEPWEAPRVGVQTVLRLDETVNEVVTETSDKGFWIWREETWLGTDDAGLWDYIFNHRPWPLVIYGRYHRDEVWEDNIKKLIEDEMSRNKSAWRPRERRP